MAPPWSPLLAFLHLPLRRSKKKKKTLSVKHHTATQERNNIPQPKPKKKEICKKSPWSEKKNQHGYKDAQLKIIYTVAKDV